MPILAYNLIALGLASGVAGDGWDDFTNNLATDLAPIISLFGEEATKQYLSESLHWIDYFIFAMAPIGILTALVSAIRVCGSSSLKAFIGKAREGTGNVEAELLSSTSHNVCELYNSGGITRIFGRPKILEFVHDPNAKDFEFTSPGGMAGISTFQNYVEKPAGKEEWAGLGLKFSPEEYAPNLSHNVGIKRLEYMWFMFAAILGFVLQAGVLIFAGIATYLLKLEKEGAQPPGYACPMVIIGTAMLCGGMFFCAVLVGESTEEQIYARKKNSSQKSTMYWLQPSQVLGDQTFESFCYVDEGHEGSLSRYVSSWKKDEMTPKRYVWLAVGITVAGFVLQFVGFRGTHSAISMAQLGAALVMSVARAALRTQRLDIKDNLFSRTESNTESRSEPHTEDIKYAVEGHELDWLALEMGKRQLRYRPHLWKTNSNKKTPKFERLSWSFNGMGESGNAITQSTSDSSGLASSQRLLVTRTFAYRRALSRLTESQFGDRLLSRNFTNDMVSVREMAEKLGLAIESVADVFFSIATMEETWASATILPWTFKYGIYLGNGDRNFEELSINLNRQLSDFGGEGIQWKLDSRNSLEAILGLWLWSFISHPAAPKHQKPRIPANRDRSTTSKRRIISFDKNPKDLGFDTWFGGSCPPSLKMEVMAANHEHTASTIWRQPSNDSDHFEPLTTNNTPGHRCYQLFGWYAGEGHAPSSSLTDRPTPLQAWAIPTSSETLSLCAQEVLGVFVKSILNITADVGQVQPDPTKHYLKSTLLSKVLDAIVASGVASRDDAVWCILPQLTAKENSAQRTPLWHAAGIGCTGLVESLLREADVNLELNDSKGRTALWEAAANGHDDAVLILLNHGADAEAANEDGTTALIKAAENGYQAVVRLLIEQGGADLSLKNVLGRTSLHLAAANGHAGVVQFLLEEEGANDMTTDKSGATPLSLAIDSGHTATIKLLNAHSADHRTHTSHQSTEDDQIKGPLAEGCMEVLQKHLGRLDNISPEKSQRGSIKVAILCSGIDLKSSPWLLTSFKCGRLSGMAFRGWSWREDHYRFGSWREDHNGFGTKLATLIVKVSSRVNVFVAKVTGSGHIPTTMMHAIPQAIEHATSAEGWDVDILVVPFVLRVVDNASKMP